MKIGLRLWKLWAKTSGRFLRDTVWSGYAAQYSSDRWSLSMFVIVLYVIVSTANILFREQYLLLSDLAYVSSCLKMGRWHDGSVGGIFEWHNKTGRSRKPQFFLKRLKPSIALHGSPSQSYGASLATLWDHTVLPATRHKWTYPTITPASQAGTRFTYPGGMEVWVDLGSLIVARPGIELTTAWSQVRRPNRNATKPLVQVSKLFLQITE